MTPIQYRGQIALMTFLSLYFTGEFEMDIVNKSSQHIYYLVFVNPPSIRTTSPLIY